MPNRLARRKQLAKAPRAIRMQVRANRSWLPPHPLEVIQYMTPKAYEAYAAMDDNEKAAIYRACKNGLKRRRRLYETHLG